jgi:sialic acid synthase SpsE
MPKEVRFKIGSRWVGDGEPLYIVAEAGVNHENDMAVALQMIDEAAGAGADAIKFQSYKARRLASKNSPPYWDRTKEKSASQFELFLRYDRFDVEDYMKLANYAEKKRIAFLTTAFDEFFVDALADFLPAFKVASADITHYPLLKMIASKGKPIMLSVGAATAEEIRNAVRVLNTEGCKDIALLHCVLNYPCPPEKANLKAIRTLRQTFPDVVIGYSDHVPAGYGLLQLNVAWLMGARIVEKHFTLDKNLMGNDHYHAMDPDDLRSFIHQQEHLEKLLGTGQIGYTSTEESARKFARRSLVASRDISGGERVTEAMIAIKRPGTGLEPKDLEIIVGKRTLLDIPEDTILQWEMFEDK